MNGEDCNNCIHLEYCIVVTNYEQELCVNYEKSNTPHKEE